MDQDPQRSLQFCHLHLAPPPAAVELGLESVTVLTEDVESEKGNVTVFFFFFLSLFVPRVKEGSLSVPTPEFFLLLSTVPMPGFEPELLRPQPGVLPMTQ